ncbi:MAG: hypothetical protein M5R36_18335 [Deltaproteobacteria bacterium]|nr:hypothetical protein [Deltaproteobacteria bacterium]
MVFVPAVSGIRAAFVPAPTTGADNADAVTGGAAAAAAFAGAAVLTLAGKIDAKASKHGRQGSLAPGITTTPYLPPPPQDATAVKERRWLEIATTFQLGGIGGVLGVLGTVLYVNLRFDVISSLRGYEIPLFVLCTSAVLFYSTFRALKLKQWVDNTPTSKIRSAAMGMVELAGKAVRIYNLLSPMSHMPCVYFRLRTYQKVETKNGSTWKLIDDHSSGLVPLYLRDETGAAVVWPQGAKMSSLTEQNFGSGGIPSTRFPASAGSATCAMWSRRFRKGRRFTFWGSPRRTAWNENRWPAGSRKNCA